MSTYRWNQAQFAAGYDAAGVHIHPHYTELQLEILRLLPQSHDEAFLLVDAGGGSGRLAELFLSRFPQASAVVVDQSEAFLQLAEQRLAKFGDRGTVCLARLQDEWLAKLPGAPAAIVSMSAIHHLDADEKRALYRRMCQALTPGGVLMNGDEIRPAEDDDYLAEFHAWSAHMRTMQDAGSIPAEMAEILDYWREKNIARFGQPKKSGDDCHETIDAQLGYLREVGFVDVDCPWQRQMWGILRGYKR